LTVWKQAVATIEVQIAISRRAPQTMSMNSTLTNLNRFVDWFIPAEIAADRETRKQARMFLYSHIFGPFIGNTVPLALYLFDPTPGVDIVVLAASITAFWIYPFVLKATGRYNLLAVISVENLIFCILWSCYFHGGVTSPTLPWVLTIPLLAFFYVGPSPTMRTIVLSQLGANLLIFFYLYQTGHPVSSGMSLAATQALGLVSTVAASLYVTMMALFYANALASQLELEVEMREHQITATALRQATDEAQRAGAAKSDFVAKMSHELRTPLNAVIGYSEILLEEAADESDATSVADLKKIHGAGHYLLKLVNEVLDLSKIEAGKMEVFNEIADCAILLRKAAEPYQQAAQEGSNQLLVETDPGLGMVYTDALKLNQTLGELIENAVQHTSGGKIVVDASRVAGPRGDEIIIHVRDTGCGIAGERLEGLFEQFNIAGDTSASKYGGTSLGLALSKKLCNLLQGDISVESQLGIGSCFTIRLPAVAHGEGADGEPEENAVAAALAAAEAHSKNLHGVLTLPPGRVVAGLSRPSEKAAVNA
jgi:signal transduction histidine kinase